jgi:hypothetical protein
MLLDLSKNIGNYQDKLYEGANQIHTCIPPYCRNEIMRMQVKFLNLVLN